MSFANSAPRGKRVQQKLHEVTKEVLEGTELRGRIHFGRRGGHQQMLILRGEEVIARLGIVSTPRNEETAIKNYRSRLNQLRRAYEDGSLEQLGWRAVQ